MSKSSQPNIIQLTQHQAGLLSDVSAFIAIIAAYLFVSFTLHYYFFEAMFGVTLRSTKDIASFYLVYSAFILGLGFLSVLIEVSKAERSQAISTAINSSLLRLTILQSFHIITAAFGATITLPELCHLSLWILIAELNQVTCQIFAKREVMASWSFFGKTIEAMIVLGQVSRFLGANPFDFI